jgi:hypothetical protein
MPPLLTLGAAGEQSLDESSLSIRLRFPAERQSEIASRLTRFPARLIDDQDAGARREAGG